LNCRIDSAWGQTSGGFSPIFSNCSLPDSNDIRIFGQGCLAIPASSYP
jgi:hypothetical protein